MWFCFWLSVLAVEVLVTVMLQLWNGNVEYHWDGWILMVRGMDATWTDWRKDKAYFGCC